MNIEFAAELLNAFNHPNFVPVGDSRRVLGGTFVERIGNDINSYEVTALTGTNTSRVVQFVTRINW